jgi:hypothetical protein
MTVPGVTLSVGWPLQGGRGTKGTKQFPENISGKKHGSCPNNSNTNGTVQSCMVYIHLKINVNSLYDSFHGVGNVRPQNK